MLVPKERSGFWVFLILRYVHAFSDCFCSQLSIFLFFPLKPRRVPKIGLPADISLEMFVEMSIDMSIDILLTSLVPFFLLASIA